VDSIQADGQSKTLLHVAQIFASARNRAKLLRKMFVKSGWNPMQSSTVSNSVVTGSTINSPATSLTGENSGSAPVFKLPVNIRPAAIAVVEDDQRTREALVLQLSSTGLGVVGFASGREFLMNDPGGFDCLVADIFMPGINGLDLQQRINDIGKIVPVVFITGRGDLAIGVQAMKGGAVDVLEKPVSDNDILPAIARALERSRVERMQRARRADLETRFRSLPARQREVFTLITAGRLNKQVAAELHISERTVKVHRERLRRKMGADSLAELSRMAEILRIHASPLPPAGSEPLFRVILSV
jgi:RNA polymerase sigma factor (sigma-70 family)